MSLSLMMMTMMMMNGSDCWWKYVYYRWKLRAMSGQASNPVEAMDFITEVELNAYAQNSNSSLRTGLRRSP
ncbi:hypothetical protein CRM22_010021 [Opisthorchis felineus]|uniref:Uncharacterized protein n=1 Tax=Opisthorchis felineus TaxID=147828 RepID=A0A4S2L9P7_OPIFE|nr:hypothetical protein CRM22_010021 [Opisthorchis felineus]